jgi:hypothetical protein
MTKADQIRVHSLPDTCWGGLISGREIDVPTQGRRHRRDPSLQCRPSYQARLNLRPHRASTPGSRNEAAILLGEVTHEHFPRHSWLPMLSWARECAEARLARTDLVDRSMTNCNARRSDWQEQSERQ